MRRGTFAMIVGGAVAAACGGAGAAAAADVSVAVVDSAGQPVADAVVSLLSNGGLDTGPGGPRTHAIDQRALQFEPYVEVVRPGDRVVFHNSDRTRHHVYSFSPGATFETIVAPGESTAPVAMPAAGVVAVGCNIHDRMVTYLYVTDAPFVARTGADGLARFASVPDGAWTVRAWQPRLRSPKAVPEQSVQVDGDTPVPPVRFALALRPDHRQAADRETATY